MNIVLIIIIGTVLTEAITELVVKSDIFSPIREFFFKRRKGRTIFNFINRLFECGYCFSVWAGFFVSLIFSLNGLSLMSGLLNFFITGLIFHRLSNIQHNVVDWTRELKFLGQGEDNGRLFEE